MRNAPTSGRGVNGAQRAGGRSVPVAVTAFLVLVAVLVSVAVAQEVDEQLGGKLRAGSSVVVSADETVEGDLIAFGGEVRVDGDVDGDLVAVGGQVDVDGEVAEDVLVTGGSVRVAGDVAGDVRGAAGRLRIAGPVGEDVLVTGGEVRLVGESDVAGDVILSAGRARVHGTVDGSVVGSAGDYRSAGVIGGDENVSVGQPDAPPTVAERALDGFTRLVGLVLVAALVVGLVPNAVGGSEQRLRQRPWTSLGLGAGGLVGAGVAMLVTLLVGLLLAVLLGLANLDTLAAALAVGGALVAALIGFALFVAIAFAAYLIVGLGVGRLGLGRRAEGSRWRLFGALALGLLVLMVLRTIPIVGALVMLAVALFGLGALFGWVWQRRGANVDGSPGDHPLR